MRKVTILGLPPSDTILDRVASYRDVVFRPWSRCRKSSVTTETLRCSGITLTVQQQPAFY